MASESIFNYFVGGLALLSTVLSMLIYLNVYLPGPRMKAFDDLLAETKAIYEKAREEDLLSPEMSRRAQANLEWFETQGDDLKAAIYHNLTLFDLLLSFFRGQSTKIADLSWDVKRLRRDVLTASQKERARRRAELLERHPTLQPAGHNYNSEDDSGLPSNSQIAATTFDCSDATTTPSIEDSTSPPVHPTFSIRAIIRRLSELFSQRTQASDHPHGDAEQPPSVPDLEAPSRSSTLVEDPLPKDSSVRRPLSFLGQLVRSGDAQPADDDPEARPGASGASSIHDSRNSSCDLTQVDLETMSSV
ncbi:hypothetical protein LshimejAT787_0111320 [Lyophyllum shimeji]|uniref:Uncharacterized protein n=1 Tax=Lyophyllum shimeji TaxID=47721 RepID=A0A9P3PF19_LYOSH|nr:hypothetical protein LshimejAT787_0111320 [Lyophyllum shimeji]